MTNVKKKIASVFAATSILAGGGIALAAPGRGGQHLRLLVSYEGDVRVEPGCRQARIRFLRAPGRGGVCPERQRLRLHGGVAVLTAPTPSPHNSKPDVGTHLSADVGLYRGHRSAANVNPPHNNETYLFPG